MADPLAPGTTAAAEEQRWRTAVGRAFELESASRARDPHHLGISGVGGCRRAAAYALAKVPVSEPARPEEGRQANLGTWQHAGLLPRLVELMPGARAEVRVVVRAAGLELAGHIDLDEPATVADLKTVGEWRLTGVRRRKLAPVRQYGGPPRWEPAAYYHHRVQVGTYGLARLQEGRPPRWLVWLYLDRASGDLEVVVEPFTNGTALAAVDRLRELAEWAEEPDEAPRDERGPGLSIICDQCPWLRACWGEDAIPGYTGPQRVHDRPQVEAALLDYLDATAREKAAKDDKAHALARVEGNPYGEYGRASYKRSASRTEDDPWKALALLRRLVRELPAEPLAAANMIKSMGLEVPTITKRGSLRVKLLAPEKESTTP